MSELFYFPVHAIVTYTIGTLNTELFCMLHCSSFDTNFCVFKHSRNTIDINILQDSFFPHNDNFHISKAFITFCGKHH